MRRASTLGLALLLGALALSTGSAAVHAQNAQASYYVASLDSTIDPGAQSFVTSQISSAQSMGYNHFVLVLNTFGGDGQSMDNIVQAISSFESGGGTFITLVGPYGAHAFSAGAYIAESSTEICPCVRLHFRFPIELRGGKSRRSSGHPGLFSEAA